MKHQLTLAERWELDVESYRNGAKVRVSSPQCISCINYIKGDALHCKVFTDTEKPKAVMRCKQECPAYEDHAPIDVKIQTDSENKIYGGLFGFCVGDALGVPVEFSAREERKSDPVKEMRAYGTYHQHFGTWSDDTSLTLCLIDAVNKGYSVDRAAKNFVAFYEKGDFTPHGEVFDIGNATRDAIVKMSTGMEAIACGGKTERDNGNGALMRILPVAFWGGGLNAFELIKRTEEIASLTHGHARSKLACIFYVEFAIRIISGCDKEEALDRTIAFVEKYCAEAYSDEMAHFNRIFSKEILNVTEEKVKSTGYVVDTLEAALWTFFHGGGYRDTILNAINLGGDTDTIAAIAGGIAGIYYGFSAIPQGWLQSLAKKEELYRMFEQFSVKCGSEL